MRIIFLVLILLTSVLPQNRAQRWTEDLNFLRHAVETQHIRPFRRISKQTFDKEVNSVINKIDKLTDLQLHLQVVRLVASLRDAHSFAELNDTLAYPVLTYFFKEGFITKYTLPKNRSLIGTYLISINNKPIKEVIEKITPLVNHDNEPGVRQYLPFMMMKPSVLKGLGIIDKTQNVEFKFRTTDGKESSIKLSPVSQDHFFHLMSSSLVLDKTPLYLQRRMEKYWFTYLKDKKAIYMQYNFILNNPDKPMHEFVKELDEFVKNNDVQKFIIDNRNNQGGDLNTTKPLISYLERNPVFDKRGRLFMITGRRTASAAMFLAMDLKRKTKVIFAGEEPGTTPNLCADTRPVILPNSKIRVNLSAIYHEFSFPNDNRQRVIPSIYYNPGIKDFMQGKDPVLDSVLNYKPAVKKTVELSNTIITTIKGKYLYTPNKRAIITDNKGTLRLQITDFVDTDLYPVSDSLFSTDINKDVMVRFDPGMPNKLFIIAYNKTYACKRIGDDYLLANELLEAHRFSEAIERLKETRKNNRWDIDVRESTLNSVGYRFLRKKDFDAAVTVFKLNTKFYPSSYNTWDSLGEAYYKMGKKELALVNYKKSLELNPGNINAREYIHRLSSK